MNSHIYEYVEPPNSFEIFFPVEEALPPHSDGVWYSTSTGPVNSFCVAVFLETCSSLPLWFWYQPYDLVWEIG